MTHIPTRSPQLRTTLNRLAKNYAEHSGLLEHCYQSAARGDPIILFSPFDGGRRHGNFLDASYAEILANPKWKARLDKTHTSCRSLKAPDGRKARELDTSTSSDALLMNIFCHRGVRRSVGVAKLLGVSQLSGPEFGYMARIAKRQGGDETEVDMRLDGLLVESKLTESDFTSKPRSVLHDYVRFRDVFDVPSLPQTPTGYNGYQIIRNVLAADQYGCRFLLICDERRPDLVQNWWLVVRAIKDVELRSRLSFLTWQQVATVCPRDVENFLCAKYGIE